LFRLKEMVLILLRLLPAWGEIFSWRWAWFKVKYYRKGPFQTFISRRKIRLGVTHKESELSWDAYLGRWVWNWSFVMGRVQKVALKAPTRTMTNTTKIRRRSLQIQKDWTKSS
jgi:hypothetical protein